jgi:5-methylcytosine-specific restriction endonuclease McrA
MKGCCYRDEPLKPGLCLREHHAGLTSPGIDGSKPRLKRCDAEREGSCPFRRWDHLLRLEVMRSRDQVMARCSACGGRHDTLLEHLRCRMQKDIEDAFSTGGTWAEEGSRTEVFEPEMPSSLLSSGRKQVRSRVMLRDNLRCQDCGRDLSKLPSWFGEVHHIVPRVRGGGDHPSNLKTLCVICHRSYTDDLLGELDEERQRSGREDIIAKFGQGSELFARLLGEE